MTKNEKGEDIAKRVIGTARIIHDCLPNASYIGFTGTPISTKDRDTVEVFGNYIDVYDMTQAVSDGATCPVYYESRVINLNLDEATLRAIDAEYDLLAEEGATDEQIEKSKRKCRTWKRFGCSGNNRFAVQGHSEALRRKQTI